METRVALIFPGQGAQDPRMFEGVADHPAFRSRYALICERTGVDVLREVSAGRGDVLHANLLSSLMTVLVSTVSLDILKARGAHQVDSLLGYSVGQWSAMYAADMLAFEDLVTILVTRARIMDECVARQPGGMSAVIGLAPAAVEGACEELRGAGHRVFISNYNCVGQYSLGGTLPALDLVEQRLQALKPKKVVRLPVAGAWHCPLMEEAAREFANFLESVRWQPARIPVIDNVTGEWLPTDDVTLRASLARHISHPVKWDRGMRTAIAAGGRQFIEVGYGNTLKKFGFFIDRDVGFESFHH